MVKTIDVGKQKVYILKDEADKPDGEQTKFIIRQITKAEKYELMQFSLTLKKDNLDVGALFKKSIETFKKAVVRIENLEKSDGTKYTADKVDDDVVETLPDEVIQEVSGHILQTSVLNEEQRKNLKRQSG